MNLQEPCSTHLLDFLMLIILPSRKKYLAVLEAEIF